MKTKCKCGNLKCSTSKQCQDCYLKFNKGSKHPSYIDGRTSKKYYCVEKCGREIHYTTWKYGRKRCKSCSNKGSNNPNWNNYYSFKTRNKMSERMKGKKFPGNSKRMKLLWKNKQYRSKTRKLQLRGNLCKPNKPEQFLIKLFKKLRLNYKFVGDGKVILSGFCPDFINKIQKKIIELYGDYWHTKSQYVINKDKRRLIEYKKRGYKTLIIWEHELKDLDKITNKLIKFTV